MLIPMLPSCVRTLSGLSRVEIPEGLDGCGRGWLGGEIFRDALTKSKKDNLQLRVIGSERVKQLEHVQLQHNSLPSVCFDPKFEKRARGHVRLLLPKVAQIPLPAHFDLSFSLQISYQDDAGRVPAWVLLVPDIAQREPTRGAAKTGRVAARARVGQTKGS